MTPEQFAAALATNPELRLAAARTLDAYMSLWRGLSPRQRETTLRQAMTTDLATAEDFQACVEGDHGPEWSDAADEFIQRTCDWPSVAAWAEWRNVRAGVVS